MELAFSRRDMMTAMKMVAGAAGKPTALPVLSSVLISAAQDPLWKVVNNSRNGGDSIYLAATDLETGIRTMIPGRIKHDGAIALPVRTFADVVSALSQDEVKLIATNGKARIQSENGEFKIVGISADEFPSLMGEVKQNAQLELTEQPADEKRINFISLDSYALGCLVRKTAFAASRDDSRYFLNGVCLSLKSEVDSTMVRMAATDGTRLAVASMTIEQPLKKETDVGKDSGDIVIAVNVHYLMDALKAVDSQKTLIGIDSEVKPMVIRPTTGDHLCVIMPVRL